MKLGGVVIEGDRELARKRLQQILKVPEEQVDEFAIYGSPEDVLRQKELFEEAGIQYLIVNLDPSKPNRNVILRYRSMIDLLNSKTMNHGLAMKPRKYSDILVGQFEIGKIIRVNRKNDEHTISDKIFDFSRNTIQQLKESGYNNTTDLSDVEFS